MKRTTLAALAVVVVLGLVAVAVVFRLNSADQAITSVTPASTSSKAADSPSPTPASSPGTASPSSQSDSSSPSSPSTAKATLKASQPASLVMARNKAKTLSLEEKIGQLMMVSSPVNGPDDAAVAAFSELGVGNVFIKGRSTAGQSGIKTAVSAASSAVSAGKKGIRPYVSTDQEGGYVQIMQGPGFEKMPQAVVQGSWSEKQLKTKAQQWGSELVKVGVNVNLAPVLDTVPGADFAGQNAPIGYFGRNYGFSHQKVSSHGLAFAQGMSAAGVAPTIKHFPGLGRVTGNTDVTSNVVDSQTVRNDAYLLPFKAAVKGNVRWLMVSNAQYSKIDPHNLAPFSSTIVTDMVRKDLGFSGLVISDDICDATALKETPVAERGAKFIAAGGTIALCTNQSLAPQMHRGMVERARTDSKFAAQVNAAVLLVLAQKYDDGLLS